MKKLVIGILLVCLLAATAACSSGQKAVPPATITPARTTAPPATTSAALRHTYGLEKPGLFEGVQSIFTDEENGAKFPAAPEPAGSSGVTWTTPVVPVSAEFPSDRMVVRSGNIQMVVDDISTTMEAAGRVASSYNGYVVTSQKGKTGEKNIGSISIRIAAGNFDRAMADLRSLAKSVIFESTSSQDVTEEYVDLDSRMKNLEATEAQLRKIMEGAEKTEDILSIQRELTNVRGEIEQVKGRMQYLERTSSTSLIQIQLEEAVLALKFTADKTSVDTNEKIRFTSEIAGGFSPYSYQWDFGDGTTSNEVSPSHSFKDAGLYIVSLKVTDDRGYTNTLSRTPYINVKATWKPGNEASSAWNGFKAFGRVVVNILIWLGIFSPVWIIIGVIIWLVRRRRKNRKI